MRTTRPACAARFSRAQREKPCLQRAKQTHGIHSLGFNRSKNLSRCSFYRAWIQCLFTRLVSKGLKTRAGELIPCLRYIDEHTILPLRRRREVRTAFLQDSATKFDALDRPRARKAANCTHDRPLDDKESAQRPRDPTVMVLSHNPAEYCVALFRFTNW